MSEIKLEVLSFIFLRFDVILCPFKGGFTLLKLML